MPTPHQPSPSLSACRCTTHSDSTKTPSRLTNQVVFVFNVQSGFTRAAGAQVKSAPAAAVSAQVQPAPYTDTHDLEDILKAMQVSAMINLVDLMDLSGRRTVLQLMGLM